MATWFLIIFLSLSFTFILRRFLRRKTTLPPNPNFFPFLGPLRWFRQGFGDINSYLRSTHHRLGPIISLRIIFFPAIFVSDRFLTHKALVLNGAVFSDRPPALPTGKIITSNQHTISSGSYGATWRLLRRNLTSEILNPSRVRSFSHARRSVLEILISRFRKFGENGEEPIVVVDHLRYAMFSLLVLMCFGDKIDEEVIKKVEFVQRRELTCLPRFNILNLLPNFFTKFFLRKRWEEFYQIRREHKDVLLPLIRSRRKMVESCDFSDKKEYVQSYVDTLLDLELPEEEKRKLNEDEIVSLCSEFLNAGTDTTATALQWIMANLVKNQEIQETLYKEIKSVIGGEEEEIKKMKYLKAVVLEGLRLHPPGHLLLPHRVSEDTELGGFKVPKRGTINFNVAEIGRDSTVWDEPMEFKPERFFETEEVDIDITGSRGIKMIPFGAGRRICPGIGLAMLHLEYFVANLVKEFKWIEVDGDQVDLSEKLEFTVVMKYPLKAIAVPRR